MLINLQPLIITFGREREVQGASGGSIRGRRGPRRGKRRRQAEEVVRRAAEVANRRLRLPASQAGESYAPTSSGSRGTELRNTQTRTNSENKMLIVFFIYVHDSLSFGIFLF